MTRILNADVVRAAILTGRGRSMPGVYETADGVRFRGMPVSQTPGALVACGWRNVSRLDESDFKNMGLMIERARYVGGACPARFCAVIVADL